MDRRKIENITASIAISLLLFMTITLILFSADQFFSWNLFPASVEKIILFILVACGVTIFSAVMTNIMINMSIIAINSDVLVEGSDKHGRSKPSKSD